MSSQLLATLRDARTRLDRVTTAEPGEAAVARRLTREIDEAIARLEGRPQKDLVSVVCHDLKDPLASIVMGAGFLRKTIAADEGAARRVVDAIVRSADRMSQVVADFHDLAKLQAGLLPIDPRPCDVVAAAQGAVDVLQPAARERGITLALQAPADPPLAVCDRGRVVQALSKLVGNALKFSSPGARVVVDVAVEASRVRLSVVDTGRGIAPERLSGIFDHAENARRTPRDGPGLGLAIVRGLVELHGGEITVDSKPGEGSTFAFTLPRA